MMEAWGDEAVMAAATEAGAIVACESAGRPPGEAAGLRAAAQAELARRAVKRSARRAPAPIIIGRVPKLHFLRELWTDPMTQGALAVLWSFVRITTAPWRVRVVSRASTTAIDAAQDSSDLPFDRPEENVAAAAVADGMADFRRRIERMRATNEAIAAALIELPYPHPYRHLIEDLVDYASDKLRPIGRPVEVNRLADPALGLPPTALAVLNASNLDYVAGWRDELIRKKWSRAPRRAMLLRLHREGLDILAAHPLPSLGQCEPGPPRGIWPPLPPPDGDAERTAPGGRQLAAAAVVRPPA